MDSETVKRNCKGTDDKEERSIIARPCRRVEQNSEVDGLQVDQTTFSLEEIMKILQNAWREKEINLTRELEEKNKEIAELRSELILTLEELGRCVFENDKKDMKKRREDLFEKTFKVSAVIVNSPTTTEVTQLPQAEEPSTSSLSMQTIEAEATGNAEIIVLEKIPRNDSVVNESVQESREATSDRGRVRLSTVPSSAVERSIYNHYKLLMHFISDTLLSNDVRVFKMWASDTFAVNTSSDVNEVFLELDRMDVISSSNLTQLRQFFSEKMRFDVVHLIDCFLLGDYTYLNRSINSRKNNKPYNNTHNGAQAITPVAKPKQPTGYVLLGGARNSEVGNSKIGNYPGTIETNSDNEGLVVTDGGAPRIVTLSLYDTRHAKVGSDPCKSDGDQRLPGRRPSPTQHREPQVGSVPSNSDGYQRPPSRRPSREPQVDIGSNGNKLSKPQHQNACNNHNPNPQNSDDDDFNDKDEKWLCNHYKRRSHVKFACCDKYWPCHRCHNNESNCGQKRLKSIHTKFVKCVKCNTEQEFNETAQFCVNCHTKFAKYFCPICKHLTGDDDNPYHCEQCGICRIHKHRSFHCDTCGVCLDVQLRDNHKCREGSAHDECCICLEDAFTGCQILPCSHKVHKECATQMIRSGITRCPICRESFAHKLEKRPATQPSARKHHGK